MLLVSVAIVPGRGIVLLTLLFLDLSPSASVLFCLYGSIH